MDKQKTVAVALAGGGVTGYFFEAGSVRAMLDCNLYPSKFSGVSAGAAVAAIAAYGLFPDEYDPFAKIKVNYFRDIGKLSIIPYGIFGAILMMKPKRRKESWYDLCFRVTKELVDMNPLESCLVDLLHGEPKDLYITATDIDNGQSRVFTKHDNVPRAVRASCSFPGIGKPTHIDGRCYVDGIVSCTANLDAVSEADIIICVNPITFSNVAPGFISERGMFKIFDQSFRTLNRVRLTHDMKKITDHEDKELILIEPENCKTMIKNPMRKDLRADALKSGYDFTLKKLAESEEVFTRAGITLSWPETARVFG